MTTETTTQENAQAVDPSPSDELLANLAAQPDSTGPARSAIAPEELEDAARALALDALRAGHLLMVAARDFGRYENHPLVADAWMGILRDLGRDLTQAAIAFREASDIAEDSLMFKLATVEADDE